MLKRFCFCSISKLFVSIIVHDDDLHKNEDIVFYVSGMKKKQCEERERDGAKQHLLEVNNLHFSIENVNRVTKRKEKKRRKKHINAFEWIRFHLYRLHSLNIFDGDG